MADLRAEVFEADRRRVEADAIRKDFEHSITLHDLPHRKLEAAAKEGIMPSLDCTRVFEAMNAMLLQLKACERSLCKFHDLVEVKRVDYDCLTALKHNLRHRGFAVVDHNQRDRKATTTKVHMRVDPGPEVYLWVTHPLE